MQIGQTGITIQEFATIYNLIAEWNKNNPSDAIKLDIKTSNVTDINVTNTLKQLLSQIKIDYEKDIIPVEKLLNIDNQENYFFEFKSSGITYNNDLDDPSRGRINEIKMKLAKLEVKN